MLVHAVTEQRVERDRQETSRVAPVLKELALLVCERIERVYRIGAEARERGYVVRSRQDVDGIDLEGVDARREPAQMLARGLCRPRSETLGNDREPARLGR